jgi:tape measure domain-containing protein
MANGGNKDVVLRIRSQNEASKAFKDIAASIEDVQKQLAALNKNAASADGSVDELAASLKAIEVLSKKLSSAQGVDQYFKDTRQAVLGAQRELIRLRNELIAVSQANTKLKEAGNFTKQNQQDYEKLQASVKAANAALQNQLKLYRDLKTQGAGSLAAQVQQVKASADQAVFNAQQIAAVKKNFQDIEAAQKQASIARQKQAEDEAARIIQARQKEERAAIDQFQQQKKIYDAMAREERELTNEVEKAARERTQARRSERASAGTGGAASASALFEIDRAGARTTLDFFQRLRGQILAVGAAYTGIYGAINQFNKALEQQRTLTGVRARLAVALGTDDTQKIGAELAFIREQAERLGLAFVPLANDFSRFQAAATQAGAGLSETRVIFTRMAEAGRVLNLSTDELQGTFNALEQIFSKGTIQLEELKGQLGDRLPGAVAILAKALGKPQDELLELIKQGKITSNVLLEFANTAGDAFAGGLETATQSLTAELARTENVYSDLRSEFVKEFEPFLIETLKELRSVLSSPEFRNGARIIAETLGTLARLIPPIVENLHLLALGFVALSGPRVLASLSFVLKWAADFRALLVLVTGGMTAATTAAARFGIVLRGLAAATGVGALALIAYEVYQAFSDTTDKTAELGEELELATGRTADLAHQEQLRADQAERRLKIEQELAAIQNSVRAAEQATAGATKFVDTENETRKLDTLGKKLKETADDYDSRVQQIKDATVKALENLATLAVPIQSPGETDADFEKRMLDEAKKRVDEQIRLRKQEVDAITALERQKNDQLRFLREEAGRAEKEQRENQQRQALSDLDNFAKKVLEKNADLAEAVGDKSVASARAAAINAEFNDQMADLDRLEEKLNKFAPGTVKPEFLDNLREAIQLNKELATAEEKRRQSEAAAEKSRKRVAEQEKVINDLLSIRQMRLDEISDQQQVGAISQRQAQEQMQGVYEETNDLILQQIQLLIVGGELTDEQRVKYELLMKQIQRSAAASQDFFAGLSKEQINETAASGLTDAFFEWADGIKSAREALRDFAADFLRFLAEAIIREQALALIQAFTMAHDGGVVGGLTQKGNASPLAFMGASRYHTGGIVGLAPNEVPAILERGEEVITREDPRHIYNGGTRTDGAPAAAAAATPIQIVNAFDPDSAAAAIGATPGFGKAIYNYVNMNKTTLRQLLSD